MKTCDKCIYSELDYYYIGERRIIRLTKSEFVRCDRVKEILENKDSIEPARVIKYFADICPFFKWRK